MSQSNESFTPYVLPEEQQKEFSVRSIILGVLLGLFFSVGNAYLGLKIGTTISASIPAAVLSMAILRLLFKSVTILENNIVQTIASVGEGLAAGIIFTIPALYFLGDVPSFWKVFFLSILGGTLGIFFMIPMRRFIIVKEHGVLPFPEGTACAEILKAGEKESSNALMALLGIAIGAIYKLFVSGLHFWKETVGFSLQRFAGASLQLETTPSLLGVGYIIGPRIAALMFGGGVLGWWVLIPLIKMFGDQLGTAIFPSTLLIAKMSAEQIWSNYIRYIGAGTVAAGGVISVFRIAPMIFKTVHVGLKELFQSFKPDVNLPRTDRDIKLSWLLIVSFCIMIILYAVPAFHLNFVTIAILLIIGYFFVAVTSISVGLVGSSSNPASGMTITTLLITSFIFLLLGWTERIYLISVITMSAVANVAITLAATTSQDLKTGYILGATPYRQQIAELIGIILPAAGVAISLTLLNKAYGFGSEALPAPQATLMAMIVKGVILKQLPWTLVIIGIFIGVILALLEVPILPFAIGLYLPIALSTSIMLGGLVRLLTKQLSSNSAVKERGILTSSGLVAGDASMGVLIALFTVLGVVDPSKAPLLGSWYSLLFYLIMASLLTWIALHPKKTT